MLTALIVKTYRWLVELTLWVFIVAGGIAASRMELFVDIALNDRWFIDKRAVGFVSGALAAFFVAAIIFGAVLILIEIQKSLRRIETKLERNNFLLEEPDLIPQPTPAILSAEKVELQEERGPIPQPISASSSSHKIQLEEARDAIPQPMPASSSSEKIEFEEEPGPIPQTVLARAAAEKVRQRVSRPRQKRKLEDVPNNRPVQGSDKNGLIEDRDNGPASPNEPRT